MTERPAPSEACPACAGSQIALVETVPVDRIADAWIGDRRARRRDADVDWWRAGVFGALQTPTVRFERCESCGLERSVPDAVWASEHYPPDEDYPVRWEFFRALADLPPKSALLEFGCGDGRFLMEAINLGHTAFGVDFSASAVARARACGFTVVHGGFDELADAAALGRVPARFDVIVAFHVIEHIADPHFFLARLGTFVADRATLVLSCPGPRRFTRLIAEQQIGRSDLWDYPPHHVLRWTLPALSAALKRAGWRVEALLEEPLPWIGAAAQIGCTRAYWRGFIDSPFRRRAAILRAWMQLLPQWRRVRGLSLYALARRGGHS